MSKIRAVASTASPGPLRPRIVERITRGLTTMQLAIDAIDGTVIVGTENDGLQLEFRFGFDAHRKEAPEIAEALAMGIALRAGVPDWPWDITATEIDLGVPEVAMTIDEVAAAVGVTRALVPAVIALPTFPPAFATERGRIWDAAAVLRHPLSVTAASA
ncbi:MAG: hypothetical protein ACOYNI_04110 [Acidimicrobiia bacterium]